MYAHTRARIPDGPAQSGYPLCLCTMNSLPFVRPSRLIETGNDEMTKPYIEYRSGYKYQLVEEYAVKVSLIPQADIRTEYIDLDTEGMLVIKKGYAWDSPSGPTIDTHDFMRGSLVHDALYQLMRNGLLPGSGREEADLELKRMCIEDGMWRVRAAWVHRGVRVGGGPAASPESLKKIHRAPKA